VPRPAIRGALRRVIDRIAARPTSARDAQGARFAWPKLVIGVISAPAVAVTPEQRAPVDLVVGASVDAASLDAALAGASSR